jgi:cobalamin-dependent methionine synthase I
MIVIGEKINSTRKNIKNALDEKRLDILMGEAEAQIACGADYIDINTAACIEREKEDLIWLLQNIQDKFDCSFSIDSPDTSIVSEAIKLCRKSPFVNSISAEKCRLSLMKSIMNERESNIIVLAMNDNGIPDDTEGRLAVSDDIVSFALSQGIDKDSIFIDPLAKPVSTEPNQARCFLETVKRLTDKGIKCTGGLSNISFGLPKRDLLNAVFVKLAMDAGISAAIIDPTQAAVKSILNGNCLPKEIFSVVEDAIMGRDDYSMNYIKAYREGRLDF